jgi:hypothetical protein
MQCGLCTLDVGRYLERCARFAPRKKQPGPALGQQVQQHRRLPDWQRQLARVERHEDRGIARRDITDGLKQTRPMEQPVTGVAKQILMV